MPQKIIGWLPVLILLASSNAAANSLTLSSGVETFAGGTVNFVNETDDFGCVDSIYATWISRFESPGAVSIHVTWTDPSGQKTRTDKERYRVLSAGQPVTYSKSMRIVHDAPLMASVFDQSAGMDDFIGQWAVAIFVDNVEVIKRNFSVLC